MSERIAILGLGVIGGSLGLALRELGHEVTGIDVEQVLAKPGAARAANQLVDRRDTSRIQRVLRQSTLAVLAMPVGAIQEALPAVLDDANLVTDCGSTKREIVACVAAHARRGRFIPGHPMAGKPESGVERASSDLFKGARWLLCPEGVEATALGEVERMVRSLGAVPQRLSAAEHDRGVALTSHLPQLLASALTVLAARRGALVTAGPAFASATRVAGGPERMWSDIYATNRDEVAAALAELMAELEVARLELVESGASKPQPVVELLNRARELRSAPPPDEADRES